MTVPHSLMQLPQSCEQVEQVSPLLHALSPQNSAGGVELLDTVALTDMSTCSAKIKNGEKNKPTKISIDICVPILRICLFYNIAAF